MACAPEGTLPLLDCCAAITAGLRVVAMECDIGPSDVPPGQFEDAVIALLAGGRMDAALEPLGWPDIPIGSPTRYAQSNYTFNFQTGAVASSPSGLLLHGDALRGYFQESFQRYRVYLSKVRFSADSLTRICKAEYEGTLLVEQRAGGLRDTLLGCENPLVTDIIYPAPPPFAIPRDGLGGLINETMGRYFWIFSPTLTSVHNSVFAASCCNFAP